MYVCASHVCGVCRGQKRALDFMEVELDRVVSYYVVLGLKPQSSGRVTSVLTCWGIILVLLP